MIRTGAVARARGGGAVPRRKWQVGLVRGRSAHDALDVPTTRAVIERLRPDLLFRRLREVLVSRSTGQVTLRYDATGSA